LALIGSGTRPSCQERRPAPGGRRGRRGCRCRSVRHVAGRCDRSSHRGPRRRRITTCARATAWNSPDAAVPQPEWESEGGL